MVSNMIQQLKLNAIIILLSKFSTFLDYVQDIFETFLASTEEDLQRGFEALGNMTPLPMDSSLDKQPRDEAIKTKELRSQMEVKDVPATGQGTVA